MAYDLQTVMEALRRADAAGNVKDARRLAGIADKLRMQQSDGMDLSFLNKAQVQAPPSPGIGSSFGRGLEQLISTGKTAYGATFGDPRAAMESSLQRREAIGAKYGESPGYEEVKKAYQERGLFPAIGEYLSQIPSAIAEQTPQIATTLGLARVGSVAGVPGAIAGAAGPSYTLAYGSLLEREAEEQRRRGEAVDPSRAKAAALAVPYAALDVAATFIPMGKGLVKSIFGDDVAKLLSRGATKEAEQLAAQKLSSESFLKSLAVGTAKGVAIEVPTEVAQQALERFQAGLPLLDKSAFAEYGQTAFEVSKLGPIGTIGRFSNKSAARQQVQAFEAEEVGRKRKEAEAEQEKYRQTDEYLTKLHTDFTELSTQEKALRDELKPYQGKKGKKALAALDEEERATILEKFDTLKEVRADLADVGPEYKKRKAAIFAMREEARRAGMTPEEYFNELHGYSAKGAEKAVAETETKKAAEVDPMQAWMDEVGASVGEKAPANEFAERLDKRLSGLLWAREQGLDDTSVRNDAVEILMKNPAMAQRIVKSRKRIPGFSKEDNEAIIDALKMQLEELPGKNLESEQAFLEKLSAESSERGMENLNKARQALEEIESSISDQEKTESKKRTKAKLNEIIDLLDKQRTAVPSVVKRGVGAVEARTAGERVADREELVRLIEQFRIMQRQKGAARDDTAMTELLEKIRIAAQPVTEEVITEGEVKAEEGSAEKGTYLTELNRLREEQDKAFPEALTSILEAEQFRRENPPTTQIQGPTAKAPRIAVETKEAETTKRFVDAVLQEIEANRRAADLPSVTADEVKTLTGRITNILREAATRKFGAPAEAQAVLREQIDEIRREASVVERRPKQKGPEYEGRLRRQFNAPAPEGTLAERKEALRGRIEDAVAQYDLPMQDAAVLREAARMFEEGAGSKELVADLEDQVYRYSTGNMEMLPEIANQLKLDQSVRAEGEQTSLFTPGQQERADARVMKKRRDLLERRIAERKGKKITLEGWKAHQAEVDELTQINKDLPAVEAGAKKAPKATTPYGKEVAPEATAFTRSTSEEFIALVTKAREARETAAEKAAKANAEDKKHVADVKRAMDVLNAHITAMGARMQVLVNAVKQARRIAERAGRNSPGAKKIQDDIGNKFAEFVEEQDNLQNYYNLVRQYSKQQDVSGSALVKIVDDLYKQRDTLEKKIKALIVENTTTKEAVPQATVETEKRKAAKTGVEYEVTTQKNAPPVWAFVTGPDNKKRRVPRNNAAKAAINRYNAEIKAINKEIAEISEVFGDNMKNMAGVIAAYKSKIGYIENFLVLADRDFEVKGGALDILEGNAETYLKDYINRNKRVQAALAEATSFREVFDTLQQQRREILSRLAGEERAKVAIKAGEGLTPAERVAASEAEIKRQTGLGLPGVRVERSKATAEVADAKRRLAEAKAEIAQVQEARDAAKSQQRAALTRQLTRLKNRFIPELEQDLAKKEAAVSKTSAQLFAAPEPKEAAPTKTAYQEALDKARGVGGKTAAEKSAETKARRAKGRALAAERTTEAKEEFEAGFDEFKLAAEVSEARKPKAATKKTSPPQLRTGKPMTSAERLRMISRIAKNMAEGVESEKNGVDFDSGNGGVWRLGSNIGTPVDKAKAQAFAKQVKDGLPKNIKFHYTYDIAGAPEAFKKAVKEANIDMNDPDITVKGAVLPDGTVVIIGNQHKSLLDMETTIAHEIVGHYGADTLLGERGMKSLLKAVENREGGLLGLARELGIEEKVNETNIEYNQRIEAAKQKGATADEIKKLEDTKRLTALRELIARAAELAVGRKTSPAERKTFLQKAKEFFKQLVTAARLGMVKLGFGHLIKADTRDIFNILQKSGESIETGRIGAYRDPNGNTVFSRNPVYGDSAPTSAWDTVNKVVQSPQSTMDRIRSEATGIGARTAFIDRFAPLEKVAEYMKKSSQAMQMMYYARMHDQRMAWTGATVNGGAPSLSLDEKGNRIITTRGGANMQDIATELSKVKGYGNAEAVRNLFTTYLAAHRALRVGPEKLNFMGNVSAAELAEIRSIGDNIPAFVEARRLYNEYNNGLIDWLVQTGAISSELGRELTRAQDYVPYYRAIGDNVVLEIAGVKPINIGNVQQQPYLRELVGGDQKIQDFFTSALQNTSMLVDMGLRNLATKESAFALREAGLLQNLAGADSEPKYFGPAKRRPAATNVISWRDKGKDYFAIVNTEPIGIPSELTVKGMHGTLATVGGLTKIMAIPARLLRNMVTRSPLYAARQVVRDSMTNFLLAGGNMTPVASAARELGKMYAGTSEGEKMLQERGIIGGQLLAGTSEDMQKLMLQLSRGGMGWEMTLAKLDRMHMKADASARITLYNDFRKQGLSDMEATLATLESMNFSKRGVSSSVYALNMMVPFLNAQIQGLNVLYQAFRGQLPYAEKLQIQRKIVTRGLMMTAATIAYVSMMQDDEAYKNANLRDRLNNWFIKVPGLDEPIKVPIPFEIGIIFKAIPEAALMAADKDEDATKVMSALAGVIANSSPVGISTTMPQAAKPVIEAVSNYNFFTGTNIESQYEQELLPQERFREKTSGLAKGLSNLIGKVTAAAGMPSKGVSPIMIDHLVTGYTGSVGLAIAQMLGTMVPVEGATAPAEKRMSDMPVIGSLFQPVDAAGQISQFYDKAKEYGEIKQTFDKLINEGRVEEAQNFAKEYATRIAMADLAEDFKRDMGEFTQLERNVRASDMSPKEKREQLDTLRQAKIQFAKAFNAASRQQ